MKAHNNLCAYASLNIQNPSVPLGTKSNKSTSH